MNNKEIPKRKTPDRQPIPGKQKPPVIAPPGRENPNILPGHSEPIPVREPRSKKPKKIASG